MAICEGDTALVRVEGQSASLVERLREPLCRALGDRRTCYWVRVDAIGGAGQALVSITGVKGHLRLLLKEEELEPGYLVMAVTDTVDRFGL